jgi:hypothetical protein
MSQSNNLSAFIKEDVEKFNLSPRLIMDDYSPFFYDHLTGLFKFKFLSDKNDIDELKLNFKSYLGLEQYTLEHSSQIESEDPKTIDWDIVDEGRDLLIRKISDILKNERTSEFLKPIIESTVNLYENWLIYKQLHPNSFSNPWVPTHNILKNGYLLLVSDNRDLMEGYSKRIYQTKGTVSDEKNSLGVIAKTGKDKIFSGFVVDNRHTTQSVVFEYLRREAPGMKSAKSVKKIIAFLKEQGKTMTNEELKYKILLPLKRTGLTGSSPTGYFYIKSKEDLIYSYNHHLEKYSGIKKTLKLYEESARRLGFHDFVARTKKNFYETDY